MTETPADNYAMLDQTAELIMTECHAAGCSYRETERRVVEQLRRQFPDVPITHALGEIVVREILTRWNC